MAPGEGGQQQPERLLSNMYMYSDKLSCGGWRVGLKPLQMLDINISFVLDSFYKDRGGMVGIRNLALRR